MLGALSAGDASAQTSNEQIKPYILLILDISGSMEEPTGSGPPSCGGEDTRIDHAKCAISKLVKTYGDVEFGFGRFRKTQTSGTCSNGCNGGGIDCNACTTSNGSGCTTTMRSADRFELLVPIDGETAASIEPWTDYSCSACSYNPTANPEIFPSGYTPIGGSLRGARRYFQGSDPTYATTLSSIYGAAAGTPIASDPINDVFVDGAQCRPYVVIMLTDGAETCSMFDDGNRANDNDTIDAVTALLSTPSGGSTYRIETRPIGFGIADPNTQIEGMAAAGGGHDGLYAANETQLSAAFNQIVLESVKLEICNGEDDDCDLEVDEGFQLYCDADGELGAPSTAIDECVNPGDDCDGSDDNCYLGTSDEPVNACGFCGAVPNETCNLLDDDCDGDVDEGGNGVPGSLCGGCTPQGQEVCDNQDDDCDTRVDEGLTRPCGTDLGVCTAGTETCANGVWDDCTATGGGPEICNALDDDCDGSINGIVAECYTPPNNASLDPPCQPGFKVCTATDTVFGECLGEVGPTAESCDGVDNDCDGDVDEGTGGADCDTQCGTGIYECHGEDGLVCVQVGMGCSPEVCDGIDNDGDDLIDEDIPSGGDCLEDENGDPLCLPGELLCIGGEMVCVGGTPPGQEVCDCLDNDCDSETDEDPTGNLCPAGTDCVDCSCKEPCQQGEFACPASQLCVDGYCVENPCFDVDCQPDAEGETTCVDGECVPICTTITCSGDRVCRASDGACVPDNCNFLPGKCTATQVCLAGQCIDDPCAGVECDVEGQFCADGECVATCSGVNCPDGQSCEQGECVDDPCDGVSCGTDRVCDPDNGDCVTNRCAGPSACQAGQVCDPVTGDCERDPCLGVECPSGESCTGGNCFADGMVLADGGLVDHDYVSAGGGGGCTVSAGGGLGALLLLLLWSAATRARRRTGGPR